MKKKIICLLLGAAMLMTLCACGSKTNTPATDSDVPTPEEIEEMAKQPQGGALTPVPENSETAQRPETTVLKVQTADGKTVSVDAELLCGSFPGGPDISLYGEKDSTWSQTEEGFIFALPGVGPESACAMEIRFLAGKSADAVAPGLLDEFDVINALEDLGTEIVAGRAMRCVRGSGESMEWTARITDLPAGAVAFVMCAYPEAENAVLRMQACLETLELSENS